MVLTISFSIKQIWKINQYKFSTWNQIYSYNKALYKSKIQNSVKYLNIIFRIRKKQKELFLIFLRLFVLCKNIKKSRLLFASNPTVGISSTTRFFAFNIPDFGYFSSNMYFDNTTNMNWRKKNANQTELLKAIIRIL